jgi:GTP-binding protein of the ras superfamily involved in termination of M-phase
VQEAGDNEGGDGDATANQGVTLKVAMIGDAAVGKTSLMVKYVEDTWDEDYVGTLGVNFLEKVVTVRGTEVTFSIWDLGGRL